MSQSHDLGLADSTSQGPPERSPISVNTVTAIVFMAGLAAVALVALWSQTWTVPDYITRIDSLWAVVLFVLLGGIAEIVYVPIRHGDGLEEVAFFEVVVLSGVLLLPPVVALCAPLVGFVLTEPLITRSLLKTVFNIGAFALATSASVASYSLVAGSAPRFSLPSVLGLILAAVAFAAVNLLTLAWVLNVAEGIPLRQFVREQWVLSLGMAIFSVGVAITAVALAQTTMLLLPFALLPAAALWYAYRSSAGHNEAIERNRWMVEFSTALSSNTVTGRLIPEAADALRRVFGADFVRVVNGPTAFASPTAAAFPAARPSTLDDLRMAAEYGGAVTPLRSGDLPEDWRHGFGVRVEVGDEPALLMIGASPQINRLQRWLPWAFGQWTLPEVDRPVLATLAASLGSAIRATEHLAALRDETAKMTAVVNHATDGIVVFDPAGGISVWSPAMVAITGIASDEVLRSTPVADAARTVQQLRAGAQAGTNPAGSTHFADIAITRPGGEARELQVSVVAIDEFDPSTSEALTVLTVRDMTHERRLERMKSDFIATVSHELRTPITPIKGYAQLLSNRWDRMTEAKRTDVLATIVDRADHLSRLVDDLLLASRVADIESARLDVDLADVDLMGLVQESARAFPDLASRLTVSGPTATVWCDRVRAIQCVANLIGNAGKYSPAESPIGVVTGTSEGGRWAVVDVVDHGRGIPADELDKVFERFYRVEDPMTMTTGGSGLGLFISRELARAMGGDITVESTLNEGSRFTLALPISNGERKS